MRKEDFFEVLGELDDDIVKGAKITMKKDKDKKPIWAKWGALAACLALIVSLQQDSSTIPGGISIPGTGGHCWN